MSPIFLDDGVDEVLRGWTPSQKPHAPLELRHERHRIADQIPPLDGCVSHLPTRKLPAKGRKDDASVRNKLTSAQSLRLSWWPYWLLELGSSVLNSRSS